MAADSSVFIKAGALVTGDFLGRAVQGSLAQDTTDGDLWVCTNPTTAAWAKVGSRPDDRPA
jgi:hypothetical protein